MPTAAPTSARKTTNPATSAMLRRRFARTSSNMTTDRVTARRARALAPRAGRCHAAGSTVRRSGRSEADLGDLARRFVGLEVLTLAELQDVGEDDRGEGLQLVVVVQDGVVVELPRVCDPTLGCAELFLQRKEVLVRLQVGVCLAEGEDLAQCAGHLVVGGRLCMRV